MKKRVFKQYNIPWMGVLIESLYTALPLLSIINFLSIITVLYSTIKENLLPFAPWITFGHFVLFMTILVLTLMTIMYFFVVPSLWTFRAKQMNKFESDVLEEINALREDLGLKRGENDV